VNLNIPTQVAPEEGSFPGTPRKVKKWLSELQTNELGETTRHTATHKLYEALKHGNRLVNNTRARVEVMELFRPVVRTICDNLVYRYSRRGLPLPENVQSIFDLNISLLTEMAFGYKIALSESANGNSQLPRKIYALAAHRAISYLSEILLRCVQNYAPVKDGVWHDLHQIYASCEVNNFHKHPVPDEELIEGTRSSVEDTYKRALLLSLSRPESLRKGEIVYIYNALETWVSLVKISEPGSKKEFDRLFGMNLHSDAPPLPLRFLQASEGADIRTLDIGELLRMIARKLDDMPEFESPIVHDKELPRNALVCLKTSLGLQTDRKSAHAARSEKVIVEVGLQDIHARLVDLQTLHTQTESGVESIAHPDSMHTAVENMPDPVNDIAAEVENERSNLHGSNSSNQALSGHPEWSVVNVSSGGYGLRWTGESTTRAHVGELIALQDTSAINRTVRWRIGVLRWMQFSKDNAFVCGVQTISPRIVPVMVEHKPSSAKVGRKFQKCLLLPEIISLGQASSLISPAHLFRLGELVTVQISGRNLQYELIDLEEQTGSFSQFLIESSGVGAS
jgi:hypothetical protein